MPSEIEKLRQTIAALESQRAILGDSVVDTAIGPLQEKLQALSEEGTPQLIAEETQQRKILTILFADMPLMAGLQESMDDEDLQALLTDLWRTLDQIIVEHGGRIDKHMGHGVMALWGADVVGEDDAEQAIRAALAMKQAVDEFNDKLPKRLDVIQLRAGLNAGTAIVGLVGTTSEFTAMGDTVNLAARLNQAAKAGEILISYDCYRQVRGVFDLIPQPALQLKGKAEAVLSYAVQNAKPRVFHFSSRGVEGVETSLIGRNAELNLLQKSFLQLFEHQTPQSITIVGDTGLGKSRLIQEFLAWSDPRAEDWWLFQGASSPSMTGSPYAFLREIFAFRFEIQDNDTLADVHAKMERGFAQFMPEDPQPQEKAHIVGQLLGYDFSSSPYLKGLLGDPMQIRNLGFSYLVRLFQAAAKIYPIVLFLDDIQWADSGSIEALQHVFNQVSKNTPILAVFLTRPSIYERFADWDESLKPNIRLDLKPLSKEESRMLVQEILYRVNHIPSVLRELIVGGAEGNPFYLEELVKMLIDGKVILPGAVEWTVNMDRLDTVSIPPTLAGVLQARLDALDGIERASLQRASVVGRIFWDDAVQALGTPKDSERERLEQSLAVLRRKELIYSNPDSTFSGTQEYMFKHALLRDVTYETLLKRQRIDYHARVADWLNTVSGERRNEYLPIIADHYEKAGLHDQAAKTLIEAGEQALGVCAFNDAFRFLRQAQTYILPEQRRDIAYIQLKIGEVFLRSGELNDALKYSENAHITSRELTGSSLHAISMYQVGQVYAEMGDYVLAEKLFMQALPISRGLGPAHEGILARVLFGLGNVHWRLGKLESAHAYCSESRELAEKHGETNTLLLAINRLGVLSGLLGDSETEEKMYQQVYDLAVSYGNRERAGLALNNLGALADEKGDLQKAQSYYLKAIYLAREIHTQQPLSLYLINLAHSEIRLNQLGQGREHLIEGMALAHHIGAVPWTLTAVLFFARLEAALGNFEFALQLLGLCAAHPAFSVDHQRLMEQMLAGWQLDSALVASQMEEGRKLSFSAVIQQFLTS